MRLLTRRQLLTNAVGVGAALAAPRLLLASGSAVEPFRFVAFSDTHFGLTSNFEENLSMFREMAGGGYSFGLNGGDVTDYGWPEEYARFRTAAKVLPFRVRCAPGNHDVRWSPLGPKAFMEGTGDPMFGSFDYGGCHFVLLDTTIPLSHWGHFESKTLRWLAEDLKRVGRRTPVFLCFHHWVGRDGIQTDNEREFLRVIEPYNVKVLLNGHGHSDLLWHWDGFANTMSRGLYQLSYLAIEVDSAKDLVTVKRRTKEKPRLETILEAPLSPHRETPRTWQLPGSLAAGQSISIVGETASLARWNDGPWLPAQGGALTAPTIPGHHILSLRNGQEYRTAGDTEVRADSVFHREWTRKLGGGVMSHIRLADGSLFVSSMDGMVTALNPDDGAIRWQAKTNGYCHSSPCVADGIVVVGSSDTKIHAFDRRNGKPLWAHPTDGPVYGSGAVAKGIVAIPSGDGNVYGLDLHSGKPVWVQPLPPSHTAFVQSPVATDGERFFLGAWDNYLYSLDVVTGKIVWKQKCCPEMTFAYSPAIGGPLVAGEFVVVPANGNVLYAFNRHDGTLAWKVSSPADKFGYSSPTVSGGRIVVGCLGDKGQGRCVSLADGKILWTAEVGSVIYDSGPTIIRDVAVFGSVSGLLSAASMYDGAILGQYKLPTGHLLATPASDLNRVYIGSFSDEVSAFSIRT